jgi:ABC-2 type transport system permease protein
VRAAESLWHAMDLYGRLIALQVRSQFEYRTSILLDMVATITGTLGTFASLALILARFKNVGGWTLGEVAFLYGMVEMAFGVMDLGFGGFDPGFFGERVRRGTFDQLLLRPVDVVVQVLGSAFVLRRLGRVAQGIFIFVVALSLLDVHWTAAKLLYLPVVFASLVCFFGGLYIIGATITFWTVQSIEVINIFTYGGAEMMSYPMHIYERWMRQFFTFVIPAIFINYYPALYFLDKPDPLHMPAFAPFLSPLAGAGVLCAALAFWRFGLRHYASTGT